MHKPRIKEIGDHYQSPFYEQHGGIMRQEASTTQRLNADIAALTKRDEAKNELETPVKKQYKHVKTTSGEASGSESHKQREHKIEETLKIEGKSDDSKTQRQKRDFVQSLDTKAKISSDELSSASSNEAQRKIRVPQAGNGYGVNFPVLKGNNVDKMSLQGWIKDTNKTVHSIQKCLVEVKSELSALSDKFENFLKINHDEEIKNETELDCKTMQVNNIQQRQQKHEQKQTKHYEQKQERQQQQQQQERRQQQPTQEEQQLGDQQTKQQQKTKQQQQQQEQEQGTKQQQEQQQKQQRQTKQQQQNQQQQQNNKLVADKQNRNVHHEINERASHSIPHNTAEESSQTEQIEEKPQVENETFQPSGNEFNNEHQKKADNIGFGNITKDIAKCSLGTEQCEKRSRDNDSGTFYDDTIDGKLDNTDIAVYELVYDAATQLECTLSRFLSCLNELRASKTISAKNGRKSEQERFQMGYKEEQYISQKKHALCETNGLPEDKTDCLDGLFRQVPNHRIPLHPCYNASVVEQNNNTVRKIGAFLNGCKCECHLQGHSDNNTSISSGYKSEDTSSGCMGSISRWDKEGVHSNSEQDKASVPQCVLLYRGLKDWGLNGNDYVQRHIVTSSPVIAAFRDLKPHEI